ncbi:MAG: VOC family protein, partial [Solirubrobacteraceae bacterium]
MLDTALAHPTVFVRDLDRARAFYEGLGLRVGAEVSTGIFMIAGSGTVFPLIHRADATPPSHTIAAFQVED